MNNLGILQTIPSNHVHFCLRYLIYEEVLLNRKVFRSKHRNVTFSALHFSVEESYYGHVGKWGLLKVSAIHNKVGGDLAL